MKAVVFLGPSLPLGDAKTVLPDAVYLPPARQADLLSAVGIYRPDVIGLIDGEFGQSLSVWHKEILFALTRGVAVYGASSMGALRAAETAAFGMRGVGRIFEMYASGELTDDDEVALTHGLGDTGYRNLSEPMVNLRATFQRARDEGVIDDATCIRLIATAKALFFPERTLPRVFQEAAAAGIPTATLDAAREFARHHYVDLKRQDALDLLRVIRDTTIPVPPERPHFEFQRTRLFEALYNRDRRVRHEDTDIPLACIANWAALQMPGFSELNFHALNRALVAFLGELLDVKATTADIEQEERRFRISRRLTDDAAFERWQRNHDLELDEFHDLMKQLAVCRRLQRWLINSRMIERTTRLVLDELRLRGDYEEAAASAAQQEQILDQHHPDFREFGFHDLPMDQLVIDHLRATRCDMHIDYKDWAEEAGFHTLLDLRVELLRAGLARQYAGQLTESLVSIMEQLDAPDPSQ